MKAQQTPLVRRTRVGLPLVATLVLFAASAAAHISVVKTFPADKSTVDEAPELVKIWFSQPPNARLSRLDLRGPSGDVSLRDVEIDPKEHSISAAVAAALAPGRYEVSWRTAGDDGHVMRGTFVFIVGP